MYETGTAFKAPKISDIKAWNKLKLIFESGYKFNSGFGNPFEEQPIESEEALNKPKSEFKKVARKRSKNA